VSALHFQAEESIEATVVDGQHLFADHRPELVDGVFPGPGQFRRKGEEHEPIGPIELQVEIARETQQQFIFARRERLGQAPSGQDAAQVMGQGTSGETAVVEIQAAKMGESVGLAAGKAGFAQGIGFAAWLSLCIGLKDKK